MGYGTVAHLRAIAALGPTPHHRRSFAPLAQGRLDLV
jgi:ribonuclease HII